MSWTPLSLAAPSGNFTTLVTQTAAGRKTLVVHPWVHGIGEGSGHYRYLSFPNAVAALADQLADETDSAFGIGLTAANCAGLAGQIKALTDVFPIKQLDQVRIRAEQLVKLETDKLQLPGGPGFNGGDMALSSLPLMATLKKAAILQQSLADAETFEASNPLTNLQAFIAIKADADAAVNTALSDANALFVGGAGWRFYAESDLAAAIKNAPGHENTMTAIVLFIGSVTNLALLKEVFP